MHHLKFIGIPICVLLSGQFSATALAQESSQPSTDPMEVCYRMSDADLRHACFDQEMARRHAAGTNAAGTDAAGTTAAGTNAPRAAPAAPAAPADTVGLDGKQLSIRRKELGIQPEVVKPIVSAIARLKPRPGDLYDFELDNGQVWESIDGQANLLLGPHESVLIRPGALGAFFLKTPGGRSIRVHRVR